jgi:hypothetical protein
MALLMEHGTMRWTRESRTGGDPSFTPRSIHIARLHDHPGSSKILPQPYDSAPDALLFRHGEVFIPPVERMKNSLPADFFELTEEYPLWAAVLTLDHHVITRLTGKIRIDENDLTFAEEGLHGIVSNL